MRKVSFIIACILFVLSLTACENAGITDHVAVDPGSSVRFSQDEIESAAERVKDKFKDFKGCELTNLWYDEEHSDSFIKGYLRGGKGSLNGATAENTIVLLSSFKVDASGGDGSLNPNSTYEGWNWILIRESESGEWKVDDWGY